MDDLIERLAAFAEELISDCWFGNPDGADIQDAAEKHGLIKEAVYDPEIHGEPTDAYEEPGDLFYELADDLAAALQARKEQE